MKPAKIFISYNAKDKRVATSIAEALKRRDYAIAIDTQLRPGGNWREALTQGLETSDVVISLVTINSVAAPYPMAEIGMARALKKILIPVVVGVDIPIVIQDIHCIRESFDEGTLAAGMKRIVNQISDYLADPQSKAAFRNNKVFIVHGHDDLAKNELKEYLGDLALDPIVLHQRNDLGLTIIEKFERYAAEASFAFVLLTPDDQQPVQSEQEQRWRARQNVIMELGWFMAKLGRERVILLHKGEVEIPSDILGVIYLPFMESIREAEEQILLRLAEVGLIPGRAAS